MGIPFWGRWLGRSEQPALNFPAETPATGLGDAESQFSLGRKFAGGEGVVVDYESAVGWYLKAATQGHCVAQFNLGLMYGQGQGVLRDDVAALMWLRKAAELGHAGAQYHVGMRQHRASKSGSEPEASECRVEAFKWLQLAMAQGHRGSESAGEFVALNMTHAEVAEGGKRVGAFTVAVAKPGGDH